jgi:pimeloyl-ACP methyl ester carboxylesterase
MSTAPTPLVRPGRAHHLVIGEPVRQLLWLLAAGVVGFLMPYLFTDVVSVPRDGYYAIHAAVVFALFLAWTHASGLSLRSLLVRNWKWAIALGAAAAAILAAIAFTFDSTPHPHGLSFAGAILWRGIVYGSADGVLLGALPVLIVFTAFPFVRGRAHLLRTVATGALALVAAIALTAVYHLGYSDFRSSKVATPMRGTAIWSAPTLLTLNPIGSVIAHTGQHVAAVIHSYEGDTYLPPHASTASAIALEPCSIGTLPAQCGTLSVAENPSEPNGAQIALNVAVVKAQSSDPKHDPLFWFAGWGSGGVTDDAANVVSAFTGVNVDRDIVFIDQRGTGSSQLVCRLEDTMTLDSATLGRITAAARNCADRIGPNLRYYTSAFAVDDFDQVRQALGYGTINIYGGSYGVTTGQIYLLRHGANVRTAVFDSGSLLDVHLFEQQPPNFQRALELLFARCAADAPCHAAYPNLRSEYEQIVARLAHGSIPIPGATIALNPVTFAAVLDTMLAYTPGKAAVPRIIHLVATGKIARAAALVTPESTPDGELVYKILIQCSEPWASWRPATIERVGQGTFLRPFSLMIAANVGAACAGFPKVSVPAAIGERVHSSVPVLFLSGNEDGADPPANIAHAQRELPNSLTVIFPGAGHGQLGLLCAQNLIASFVGLGSTEGIETSCAQTAALQPFDTRK